MFIPHQDFILVRPVERKQSEVLWVSPEKYSRGVVVAVGPGKWLKRKNGSESGYFQKLTVKVGDFITYAGNLDYIFPIYREDGIEYRILQEADITFICDPDVVIEAMPPKSPHRMVTQL